MEKKKNIILPIIILVFVALIAIVLVVVFKGGKGNNLGNIDKNKSVSKASELIVNDYQSINCIDDCEYLYAYKGEDKLTGKFDFYNEVGKKIGEFDLSKVDPKIATTFDIEAIADSYFIASYLVAGELDYKYVVYNMKGKVLLEASDAEKLTNKYFTADDGDKEYLFDNSGKAIYEDIENTSVYNDKYITFRINKVDKIIDENAKEILSGYTIAKVILDENEEIDYLIIRNTEDSVYNYYNIKDNSKKGDSFTNYTTDKDKVIITKKVDSKNKKFVLNSNGEQAEYVEVKEKDVDTDAYYNAIKEKVDTEKYGIFKSTLNSENQNYILVDIASENKYGVLDVAKGEFKELGKYKENSNRRLNLKKISGNDDIEGNDDIIYSIECTTYNCDNNVMHIYNFSKNELLFERDAKEKSPIYSYKLYDNGYYVFRTTTSKFDDSNKYFLYDNKGEELFQSDDDIKIIDSKLTYYMGTPINTGKINLYSLKEKKVINLDDDEILSVTGQKFGNNEDNKLYQFVSDDATFLINDDGGVTKLEGTYKSHDSVGVYLSNDNKISYYNVFTKDTTIYELGKNESINGSTGKELVPYRNAIFVNNSYDNTFKIIGVNGKVLLEKKDLQIHSIHKRADGSILVMVTDKDDSKGMYIVR